MYVENFGEELIYVEVIKIVLILYFFVLMVIKMKKKRLFISIIKELFVDKNLFVFCC